MAPKLQRRARPDRSAETAKRQKQRRAAAAHGQRPDRSAETAKRQPKRHAHAKAKRQAAAAEKAKKEELFAAALRAVQVAADKANYEQAKQPAADVAAAPGLATTSSRRRNRSEELLRPTGRCRGCSLFFI